MITGKGAESEKPYTKQKIEKERKIQYNWKFPYQAV